MQQQLLTISDAGLEQASTILRDTLLLATSQSILHLRPSPRSKPWWNNDLTTQRQQMHKRKRRWKTTRGDEEWKALQASRNIYFHAIQQAKQADRRTFLATAKGKDVFTAYKYTKPSHIQHQDPHKIRFLKALNNPTTNWPQIFAAPSLILTPTPIKFADPALFFYISYCKSCGCCSSYWPLSYPCQG